MKLMAKELHPLVLAGHTRLSQPTKLNNTVNIHVNNYLYHVVCDKNNLLTVMCSCLFDGIDKKKSKITAGMTLVNNFFTRVHTLLIGLVFSVQWNLRAKQDF